MDDVQHIYDVDHYYNGGDGRWTVCGEPMPATDTTGARPVCTKCLDLWVPANERRKATR